MTGSNIETREALLTVKNATIQFGERTLFQNLSFSANQGEFLSLLGPSGSGKSTLLRLFAGLQEPSEGSICWNVNSSAETSFTKGFVFQESQLLAWRNVLENTLLPFELQNLVNLTQDQKTERAGSVLKQLGLKEETHALYPHQLSGGMKMRVSIARALVARPQVIFMDEPFAALDETARFRLQSEFRKLAEVEKLTVFFVTHSSYEAAFLSDRIITLEANGTSRILSDEPVAYRIPRGEPLRESPEYLEQVRKLRRQLQKEPL